MATVKKADLSRAAVLVMVIGITLLFFWMIRGFFMAIVLAAIFSGLLYGFFERLNRRLGGRRSLASMLTIAGFILVVLIPAGLFLAVVVDQALNAARSFLPAVQARIEDPDSFIDELERIPLVNRMFPEKEELLEKVNQAINALGGFVADGLSSVTSGTVNFFFLSFIFLFTMYYFLIYGKEYLNKFLFYMPLRTDQERLLLEKFTTVTRATLKGTLIIGIVQGALGAGAMALAGISNTIFWGVIMAVMSVIPAVGPAVIWLPAAVFLIIGGRVAAGVGLLLFGAIVVGNIDNLLRPRLVGKDAQLPDLMILFGTLGGLALFGMSGIIIGPIVAALFVTMWEIYGETFKDSLYSVNLFEEEQAPDDAGGEGLLGEKRENPPLAKGEGNRL